MKQRPLQGRQVRQLLVQGRLREWQQLFRQQGQSHRSLQKLQHPPCSQQ